MIAKYAYTIKTERVKEKDFPYNNQALSCTADLRDFLIKLKDWDIEKFVVIYLDAQNKVICLQIVSGTVNQAVVYPREVVRHALLAGASAVILAHNHPSGAVRPSDADIRLTKTITEAARLFDLLIHDHIIMGEGDKFFSFREEGILP